MSEKEGTNVKNTNEKMTKEVKVEWGEEFRNEDERKYGKLQVTNCSQN